MAVTHVILILSKFWSNLWLGPVQTTNCTEFFCNPRINAAFLWLCAAIIREQRYLNVYSRAAFTCNRLNTVSLLKEQVQKGKKIVFLRPISFGKFNCSIIYPYESVQRNIQRFFDSTKRNNFCIEHLDMAGLVTILKKEACTLTLARFSFFTSLFVTFCFVTFRAKEVITFCAKNLLHFALCNSYILLRKLF